VPARLSQWAAIAMLFWTSAPLVLARSQAIGTIQSENDANITETVKLRELTPGEGVREGEVRGKVNSRPDGVYGVHIPADQ